MPAAQHAERPRAAHKQTPDVSKERTLTTRCSSAPHQPAELDVRLPGLADDQVLALRLVREDGGARIRHDRVQRTLQHARLAQDVQRFLRTEAVRCLHEVTCRRWQRTCTGSADATTMATVSSCCWCAAMALSARCRILAPSRASRVHIVTCSACVHDAREHRAKEFAAKRRTRTTSMRCGGAALMLSACAPGAAAADSSAGGGGCACGAERSLFSAWSSTATYLRQCAPHAYSWICSSPLLRHASLRAQGGKVSPCNRRNPRNGRTARGCRRCGAP